MFVMADAHPVSSRDLMSDGKQADGLPFRLLRGELGPLLGGCLVLGALEFLVCKYPVIPQGLECSNVIGS